MMLSSGSVFMSVLAILTFVKLSSCAAISAEPGWYKSANKDKDRTCKDACQEQGLTCSEADMLAHNGEVDSSSKVKQIITKLGGTAGQRACYESDSILAPSWYENPSTFCYYSSPKKTLENVSCEVTLASYVDYFLCYCSAAPAHVCDEPGLQKCYADLVFGSTGANAVGGTAMCDLVDATVKCIREKSVGCATSVVEQYDALMKPVTDLACKDQGDCVAHPVCIGENLTTTTARPTACEPWCMGNSHAWSKKCTWKKCKQCEQCTPVEKPEGCQNWCAGNSHDWKAKCTWKNCKQCTECQSNEEPEEPKNCKNWCPGNSNDWATKCTWKNCRKCDACSHDRRLLDSNTTSVSGMMVLV